MHKGRVIAQRDDLAEDTLRVLGEFEGWFFPATMEEVGREFLMFLKWLEDEGYKILPAKDVSEGLLDGITKKLEKHGEVTIVSEEKK